MTARREFLKLGMTVAVQPARRPMTPAATSGGAAPAPGRFRFEEATVAEMGARMAKGEITSTTLTQAYLDRIAAVDRGASGLRSIIETNPDALKIAASLDAEKRAGRSRSPLHGLPLLVKDNIETADQMVTSAGSLALARHRARKDAFIVERLRLAGAVVLGKTNLSEWANFRSTKSSSGWSGRGGQCRNPYGIDQAMAKDRLDAILAPTGGPAWLTDLVNGDSFGGVSSSQPPAVAGYPAITVPAGFISGLPVGMTLMGAAWSEGSLIKYAYAFEQATRHRKPPTLAPTVPLSGSFE